jgi:hypothetical protein
MLFRWENVHEYTIHNLYYKKLYISNQFRFIFSRYLFKIDSKYTVFSTDCVYIHAHFFGIPLVFYLLKLSAGKTFFQ